ncbi:MAG: conserved membrane protein of unknown function [Promethearchaeota archaeon]|nr:MAG: conserved membrane protein of unknown function [Candidatus Lokiarchaeota archaeon]
MVLESFDLIRFIRLYVIQLGVGGIYFLLITFLILRRSKKQMNQIFSGAFISFALGTIINVIYASIKQPFLVKVLHISTYFLFCFSFCFLLLFNLIILKSSEIINRKKQLLTLTLWALVLSGLFIIGLLGGVSIDATTGWKPEWELSFFLYGILICYSFMIIPTLYVSIQIYKLLNTEVLIKRWRFFIIGLVIFYFLWTGTSIENLIQNTTFESIWGILSLIAFIGVYFLYYGVGKQLG